MRDRVPPPLCVNINTNRLAASSGNQQLASRPLSLLPTRFPPPLERPVRDRALPRWAKPLTQLMAAKSPAPLSLGPLCRLLCALIAKL